MLHNPPQNLGGLRNTKSVKLGKKEKIPYSGAVLLYAVTGGISQLKPSTE